MQTVVYDTFPDDKMKYIPVMTYSRILAGSLCLLRVNEAFARPSRSFPGSSSLISTCAIDINIDEAVISLALVDDAAEALRKSMIDDLYLCTRWGELLLSLSSNLRTQLEQMSTVKDGLSKNTRSSQGFPGNRVSSYDLGPRLARS